MIADLKILSNDYMQALMNISEKYLDFDETLYVALKGTFKEYLFCTDRMVYIIKRGYMTGHLLGEGVFKMPYKSITNAEVQMNLFFGYFEISAAGIENKDMNFWSSSRKNSPQIQPNSISITEKLYQDFSDASKFVIDKIH